MDSSGNATSDHRPFRATPEEVIGDGGTKLGSVVDACRQILHPSDGTGVFPVQRRRVAGGCATAGAGRPYWSDASHDHCRAGRTARCGVRPSRRPRRLRRLDGPRQPGRTRRRARRRCRARMVGHAAGDRRDRWRDRSGCGWCAPNADRTDDTALRALRDRRPQALAVGARRGDLVGPAVDCSRSSAGPSAMANPPAQSRSSSATTAACGIRCSTASSDRTWTAPSHVCRHWWPRPQNVPEGASPSGTGPPVGSRRHRESGDHGAT